MRSVSHWTPRYVRDRITEMLWQRRHPSAPWLTPAVVPLLDELLRPSDVVFEWGSGRSTVWLAKRTARVTSIERRPEWHEQVLPTLHDFPASRCVLLPVAEDDLEGWEERYVSALGVVEPGPVDVVLVDGSVRDRCALRAVDYLEPGGLLIVDDVQRYVPSRSRTPSARDDYASPDWEKFGARVSTWRRIWVSSGVTDTAIWIRGDGAARSA
jgi:predicted O-methyltransferase YrrM